MRNTEDLRDFRNLRNLRNLRDLRVNSEGVFDLGKKN